MSEENKMTEENKKTIIAFIAGLLIGGLLVFIFAEPAANIGGMDDQDRDEETEMSDEDADNEDEESEEVTSTPDVEVRTPVTSTSGGSINVADQSAGSVVTLSAVEYPAETGWIGVRDYENGQMTGLLGVTRFHTREGLLPESIRLLRATEAGRTYAVVFYSDNGDRTFNLATDVQLSGVMETFKAE